MLNGYLAYRFRPIFRAISLEQQSLDRYRLALDPFRRVLLIGSGAAHRVLLRRGRTGRVAHPAGVVERHPVRRDRPTVQRRHRRSTCSPCRGAVRARRRPWCWSSSAAGGRRGPLPLRRDQSLVVDREDDPAARVHLSILIGIFVLLKAARTGSTATSWSSNRTRCSPAPATPTSTHCCLPRRFSRSSRTHQRRARSSSTCSGARGDWRCSASD